MSRILYAAGFLCVFGFFSTSAWAGDDAKCEEGKKRNPEELFKRIDADSNGKVTKEEVRDFVEKVKERREQAGKKVPEGRGKLLGKLFEKLDADNDGALTLEEFKKIKELREQMQEKRKEHQKKKEEKKEKEGDSTDV